MTVEMDPLTKAPDADRRAPQNAREAGRAVVPQFPPRPWSRPDWLALGGLACLGLLLLATGLSVRSLWGPEGRWGMIVKEMLYSGNYFFPSVNGIVDWDKPLLSYWAILPFARVVGLKELALRLPSALAGIGTVLLTYGIGRRLFGWRAGAGAGFLLLTTFLFASWARTASADVLNLFSIWLMLWCFLAGGCDGKLQHLLLLYGIGALASFLKGPVAPAVTLFAILSYSSANVLLALRTSGSGPRGGALRRALAGEFRWLVSRQAFAGILVGLAVFSFLFLLPLVKSGSWEPARLMWKENVVRFFQPFDHKQPLYMYARHLLLFSLPWTFVMAAALWDMRRWEAGRTRRWLALTTAGIFLFFALSGARRSYYILPLVPALALIAGRALSDALGVREHGISRPMLVAAVTTSGILLLAGLAMVWTPATPVEYRHSSVAVAAACAVAGGGYALWLMLRKSPRRGLVVALSLIFAVELWTFNMGMQMTEQRRTLRSYCVEVGAYLADVENDRIGLYRENAALLFYLGRGTLQELRSVQDLRRFAEEHPDGFVIADLNELRTSEDYQWVATTTVLLTQKTDVKEAVQRFALLQLRPNAAPATAGVQPGKVPTIEGGASGWGAALAGETPTDATATPQRSDAGRLVRPSGRDRPEP